MLRISVGESQRRAVVSASSFRFALGRALGWNTLKSDWYDVTTSGDHFVFSGRGTGHGVGLCQTGAAEMARQGKTYREILTFYYPGAELGRSAKGIAWKTDHEDEFNVRAVNDADAAAVREATRQSLLFAKQATGLKFATKPTIDVFPTVAMFRDATGEPGWVAASTLGDRVRIEPPSVLKNDLPALLKHECLHLLIEANAREGTPPWFREGLVLAISGEETNDVSMPIDAIDSAIRERRDEPSVKRAYAAAAARVRELARTNSREVLMKWLRDGLPN
jgi:stage II sporulation protein D